MSERRQDMSTSQYRSTGGRGGALRCAAACLAAAIGYAGTAGPVSAGVDVWTAAGPNAGRVVALAPDPVDPRGIYAATGYGGVFKSSDGGASWQGASRGLTDHRMTALTVDPRHPGTLYAASYGGGVAVSHDGAATWASTAPLALFPGESDPATSLAIDPAHAGTVYAADPDAGVWVSRDGGGSWTLSLQSSFGALGIARLAADPVRSSVFAFIFDTNSYTLFETTDGGLTWSIASLPSLPFGYIDVDFAVEPGPRGTLYIGLTRTEADTGRLIRKTFRSSDGGASWLGAGTGGFPLAAAAGGLVISGSLRSADHGVTWTRAAVPPETVGDYAISADGARIYAGTGIQGVFASSDGGLGWQVANQGLAAAPAVAFAVDPQTPGTWYVAPFGIGLLKSRNSGRHWRQLGVSDLFSLNYCCPPSYGAMVVVDPAAPATVFYAVIGLRKSTDAGASWTAAAAGWYVRSLIPDPSSPAVVYAIGAGDACPNPMFTTFGRSADGGETFTCLEINPYEAVVARSAPATLYALVSGGSAGHVVFKSTDSGASWAPIDAGLPLVSELTSPPFAEGHLAVDPADAGRLYVSGPSGIWMTPDGGGRWIRRSGMLPHAVLSPLLAIDAAEPSVLYAAEGSIGVYRSRDRGRSWQPILAGLPPVGAEGYTALVLDPTRPGSLYLATLGNGVLGYSSQ
jgi:photosystem II stability/assembly factor-like uncharacterized protein